MHRASLFWVVLTVGILAACTSPPDAAGTTIQETSDTTNFTPAPDPTFPEPATTTTSESGEDKRPLARRGSDTASGCVTTPGALQALIDSTPDGREISDMKGKLVNAESLGFSVLDLAGQCYEDQGTITIEGRYGLWIVRPTSVGSDWVLTDAEDIVLSGLDFGVGSLTVTRGQQRIEAGQVHNLTVTDVTDFMMGKMIVTGHTVFDGLKRVEPDKSFARNSEFNTVELRGDVDGFKFENSTAVALVDSTEGASQLGLGGLSIQ